MHNMITTKRTGGALAALGAAIWALPAEAHVKWFAPYIVDASPQPIGATRNTRTDLRLFRPSPQPSLSNTKPGRS